MSNVNRAADERPPGERYPSSIGVSGLTILLRLYRRTAPLRRPHCRFYPSCSQYAIDALARYGALRGGWMAVRRLARCHPWNPGGYDPVV